MHRLIPSQLPENLSLQMALILQFAYYRDIDPLSMINMDRMSLVAETVLEKDDFLQGAARASKDAKAAAEMFLVSTPWLRSDRADGHDRVL